MKKLIALLLILHIGYSAFAQKISRATKQVIHIETGEAYENYIVRLGKKASGIKVDSIKTIATASEIKFGFRKNEKGNYLFSFTQILVMPKKCKTCPEVLPIYRDLTKGIIVYYRKGNKNASFKIKKFKQLREANNN